MFFYICIKKPPVRRFSPEQEVALLSIFVFLNYIFNFFLCPIIPRKKYITFQLWNYYFNFSFIAGSHRRDFYVYQPYEQVILKPVWWNQLGERYLGEYSAIKYRLIIEITGRTEFNTTEEIIEAAKTLKNYLAENPVYDENGQLITVPYAG